MPTNAKPYPRPPRIRPQPLAPFRRLRVFIVGCGDVGQRCARLLLDRGVRVLALTSSPQSQAVLQARGITPLLGNLDAPASLRRLAGLAPYVLHLAPPPGHGPHDTRTRALLQTLSQTSAPQALAYVSTTGVYGDCAGAWVDETRPVAPSTARAQRRVDAETQLQRWAKHRRVRLSVLRAPGIYAPNRPHGTPQERLRNNLPILAAADDVFTNHIHADDLALACLLALFRARPLRAMNVCDDRQLRMGDYFEQAADVYGLPRPPRISRSQAQEQLSPLSLSFMSESRRLSNRRLKTELRMRLRWPDVLQGLAAGIGQAADQGRGRTLPLPS